MQIARCAGAAAVALVVAVGQPVSGEASGPKAEASSPAAEKGASPSARVKGVGGEPPRVVMAEVGDQEITVRDFLSYVSKNAEWVEKITTPEGKAEVLRRMITSQLLRRAAREEGLLPEDPGKKDFQQAARKLAAKHFSAPAAPSSEEAYAYYKAHKEDFGVPQMVRVSQIQVRIPEGASEEQRAQARQKAKAALQRIRNGEPFAEVAAQVTENPRARTTQGDLGFMALGGNEWLDQAVSGLEVGEVSAVLESPVGYEIIKVTDRRKGMVTPFPNVEKEVKQRMRREKQLERREAYVAKLAERYGVELKLDWLPSSAIPGQSNDTQEGAS